MCQWALSSWWYPASRCSPAWWKAASGRFGRQQRRLTPSASTGQTSGRALPSSSGEKGIRNIYTYMSITQGASSGVEVLTQAYYQTQPWLTVTMLGFLKSAEMLGRVLSGLLQYIRRCRSGSGMPSPSSSIPFMTPWTPPFCGCPSPHARKPLPLRRPGLCQRNHPGNRRPVLLARGYARPNQRLFLTSSPL